MRGALVQLIGPSREHTPYNEEVFQFYMGWNIGVSVPCCVSWEIKLSWNCALPALSLNRCNMGTLSPMYIDIPSMQEHTLSPNFELAYAPLTCPVRRQLWSTAVTLLETLQLINYAEHTHAKATHHLVCSSQVVCSMIKELNTKVIPMLII